MRSLMLALVVLCLFTVPAHSSWLLFRAQSDIGKTAQQLGLHRVTLWCSAYLDYLTGRKIGDRARAWAEKRPRVAPCTPGSVAVMTRGRHGGHVGIVKSCDHKGNPTVISGNHNRRVGEALYPRARVTAWVAP